MAEVNDKGEVTIEGESVGRLEGFCFYQDASLSPDEARMLRQAVVQALKPELHLRGDRFYNAPDTELDFTEQGGLMWGTTVVGKLVKGPEMLRPSVEAFVDEEAGPDVADKLRRRLQHFVDRKIVALFEPLVAMSRDEALTGSVRGFTSRLVEALGVLPRDAVNEEVKQLDQEARGALRKHGVRFGQFTVFLPALLKPAPTRLRLVLWSLANGLDEFPERPPPGLVTIPNIAEVPKQHYTLSGYYPAGTRAIRIDMLERLADLLRAKDSRAGFEASPEMLSITGMTLDQFADLMVGLGYKSEKGERLKIKVEVVLPSSSTLTVPILEGEPVPVPVPDATEGDAAPVEMEIFYTFTWAPKQRFQRPERGAPQAECEKPAGEAASVGVRRDRGGDGKSGGHKGNRDGKKDGRSKPERREDRGGNPQGAKSFEARSPRIEKPIDPDNPFAVLAALKNRS